MSQVTLRKIVKTYGSMTALHEIDLEVREGEFMTLLGPSGCGKTTTLRLIAGFIEPTRGTILLGDDDVTWLPPHRRGLGMVFQDYALFPHMTVADNIGFGLKERGSGKREISRRVEELLALIRLPGLAHRYPGELSGGQAQRVAFARAIAHPPHVLLMDEPLAALDLKLREAMQSELRRLQQALKITTVFVTHDQTEAMTMSDRIAVMNHGRIEQIGSAQEIYSRPATRFVAGFVGQINLIEGTVLARANGRASVRAGDAMIRVASARAPAPGERCTIAIRPENLHIVADGPAPPANVVAGRIAGRTFSGSTVRIAVDLAGGPSLILEARPQQAASLAPGADVRLGWSEDEAILLDPEGPARASAEGHTA